MFCDLMKSCLQLYLTNEIISKEKKKHFVSDVVFQTITGLQSADNWEGSNILMTCSLNDIVIVNSFLSIRKAFTCVS